MAGREEAPVFPTDQLDYTKGLLLRFAAFRQMLETDRDWASNVVFIQVAVPTRTGVRRYRLPKEDVERRVGEINGGYAAADIPLWYLYRSMSDEELSALYHLADVWRCQGDADLSCRPRGRLSYSR